VAVAGRSIILGQGYAFDKCHSQQGADRRHGVDGRIFPVGTKPTDTASMFADDWFPIQVKQMDKVGRRARRMPPNAAIYRVSVLSRFC